MVNYMSLSRYYNLTNGLRTYQRKMIKLLLIAISSKRGLISLSNQKNQISFNGCIKFITCSSGCLWTIVLIFTHIHLIVYRRSVARIRHFVKEYVECNNDVSIKLISKPREGNKVLLKCFMAMHSSFSSLVYVFCKMQFLLIAKNNRIMYRIICISKNDRI